MNCADQPCRKICCRPIHGEYLGISTKFHLSCHGYSSQCYEGRQTVYGPATKSLRALRRKKYIATHCEQLCGFSSSIREVRRRGHRRSPADGKDGVGGDRLKLLPVEMFCYPVRSRTMERMRAAMGSMPDSSSMATTRWGSRWAMMRYWAWTRS